ncbi:MAG: helix-turn-helix transcriptional regulator [bacterium]|nr:helix-turn-helix transcriptional regulator [bacterium]
MDLDEKRILIGLKLKNYRKKAGFTQEQLSAALDLDVSGLSKTENGKSFPSLETLCKIMELLKINPQELFDFITFKDSPQKNILNEKIKSLNEKETQKVLAFIDLMKK